MTSNTRWITTQAARFGVTNDTWLFYGKAGGGWVGNDGFTITNTVTGASITGSNNNTNSGWLVGAGIEWAFVPNWSVKIEYNYLGLNSQTFTAPAGGFLAGENGEQEFRPLPSGGLLPAEHGRDKSTRAKQLLGRLATHLASDRCSPRRAPGRCCRGLALRTGADGAFLVEREGGAREGVVLASTWQIRTAADSN